MAKEIKVTISEEDLDEIWHAAGVSGAKATIRRNKDGSLTVTVKIKDTNQKVLIKLSSDILGEHIKGTP